MENNGGRLPDLPNNYCVVISNIDFFQKIFGVISLSFDNVFELLFFEKGGEQQD